MWCKTIIKLIVKKNVLPSTNFRTLLPIDKSSLQSLLERTEHRMLLSLSSCAISPSYSLLVGYSATVSAFPSSVAVASSLIYSYDGGNHLTIVLRTKSWVGIMWLEPQKREMKHWYFIKITVAFGKNPSSMWLALSCLI